MAILTRDALMSASDLKEKTIPVPSLGPDAEVRIRSLPAKYSNAAVSEAIEVEQTPSGGQVTRVDNGKLELLQVFHGLVEPRLESMAAVETFAQNCGPAFKAIVKAIVDLSGLTEEAADMTAATFPAGGGSPAGPEKDADAASNGSGGPDLHVRAGA